MKNKDFKALLKEKSSNDILSDYMTCKIFLTDKQLQKVIDLKQPYEKGHGGCGFNGKEGNK